MKSLLVKASNWKCILPAFLVCAICIYFFQNAVTAMSEIIGEETKLIDMRSDYDLAEINNFFTGLKEEGRAIHKNATKITDMIFPFGYGALFILLSAFFLKNIAGEKSNWLYISLIPIVLMIVDYKENFNTLNLLDQFPNLTDEMVNSASAVTGIKTILTNVSMGLVLVTGLVYLGKLVLGKVRK